jgi:transcriptional regulator with XRE-family HTH domain
MGESMYFTEWVSGRTHSAIAQDLHVSRSFITQIISGSKKPSIKTMRRIRDLSEGEVSADELLDEFAVDA